MQTPRLPGLSGEGPRFCGVRAAHPLVHPPVDLALDPVDEALGELVVVARPELGAGGERRLELALGLAFHRCHDRRPDRP